MSTMAENVASLNEVLLQRHYPLHWACYQGNEAYVSELLMSGRVDVYQEDGLHGWTPMHWAASQGKLDCLRALGQRPGGHSMQCSRTGETPAHIAAMGGHSGCLHYLLQHSAGHSQQDHMGDTPLHKAAQSGHLDCVKLLISHGPILSTFNRNGMTPQDLASQHGHKECWAFLEQALASQHTSFYPSNSSPILMNGEGIYQNRVPGNPQPTLDHDMEIAEEDLGAVGGQANSSGELTPHCFPVMRSGVRGWKRSFSEEDEEEDSPFKRQRLFAPCSEDKLGTENNNNVLSSYQGVLAMSVEPLKATPTSAQEQTMLAEGAWQSESGEHGVVGSSSMVDHCNALSAQHSYDSLMVSQIINSHGL